MTIKHQLLAVATAVSLAFPVVSLAADSARGTTGSTTSCEGLSGSARESCMQRQSPTARTPGRSEDAASREGGRTPGQSEDSASRTGVPPGQRDSGTMGAPAAGGTPGSGSSGTDRSSGGSMGGSSGGSSRGGK